MSDMKQDFSGLHDNRILRYTADFEAHTLCMETVTEDGRKVSVCFSGMVAYRFENVIECNILFSMYEDTVDSFLEDAKIGDLLEEELPYGFPTLDCRSVSELKTWMEKQNTRIFVIDASLGLWGFVLSNGIEINFG